MPEVSGAALWQWRQDARHLACAAVTLESSSLGELETEIDWLLQEVAGLDRLTLRLESFKDRPAIALSLTLPELTHLWQRRLQERLPLQYLVGRAPWRHFSLIVSPAVLIPRPETELLVDLVQQVVQHHPQLASGHWADLGTGSGAIALGLTTVLPGAVIHAVDLSATALAVAQENAQHLGCSGQIQFHQGSWLQPLAHLQGQLQGIVSNTPYIPTAMVADLQPEVVGHEPHLALDGGSEGLDAIREIIATAPAYLQPGGVLMLEMMVGQTEAVQQLLQQQGTYREIQIHPDLAGIERFAQAYLRPEGWEAPL